MNVFIYVLIYIPNKKLIISALFLSGRPKLISLLFSISCSLPFYCSFLFASYLSNEPLLKTSAKVGDCIVVLKDMGSTVMERIPLAQGR